LKQLGFRRRARTRAMAPMGATDIPGVPTFLLCRARCTSSRERSELHISTRPRGEVLVDTLALAALQAEHRSLQAAPESWAGLVPDLLRRCLAAAFHPLNAPIPLADAACLYDSLRLTCKAWDAALEDAPVPVS